MSPLVRCASLVLACAGALLGAPPIVLAEGAAGERAQAMRTMLRAVAEHEADMINAAEEAAVEAARAAMDQGPVERVIAYREAYWRTLRKLRAEAFERAALDDETVLFAFDPNDFLDPAWNVEEMIDPEDPAFHDPQFQAAFAEVLIAPPKGKTAADIADFDDRYADCVCVVGAEPGIACSGVLVAPNVVLTAGHCSRDFFPTEVRVGLIRDAPVESARVVLIARHPEYSDALPRRDLMVLIIDPPITSAEPRAVAGPGEITAGARAAVAGFGRSPGGLGAAHGVRRATDQLSVISADCAGPDASGDYNCTPETELVAADRHGRSPGADACEGDSGGPLFVKVGDQWKLAAIVSRKAFVDGKSSPRPCGDGGVYVRIDRFWDWIRAVPQGIWPHDEEPDPQPEP